MSSAIVAVLVAAGTGERLGRPRPKALVEVAGRPLLDHALAGLTAAGLTSIVVVHPPAWTDAFAPICRARGVAALVPGGPRRVDSVRAGLEPVPDDADLVAIHDAARAFVPVEVIRSVVRAVDPVVVAAAPARRVPDTLKRVEGTIVTGTVDRTPLRAVQTPQVFRLDVLRHVLRWAGDRDTSDELALIEGAIEAGEVGGEVRLVPGAVAGAKITYPEDLELAEALLAWRARS